MAIAYTNSITPPVPPWENSSVVKDYIHIQGKMIDVVFDISYVDVENMQFITDSNAIKQKLMEGLVKKLHQEKCMEFTKQNDPTEEKYRFHARIYAVPDTQVRVLREKLV